MVKDLRPAPIDSAPKGKLHQVVMNLLVNALQALDDRDPRQHEIRVLTGIDGRDSVLSVSDTGVGIPEEQQTRIFEPFFTTKPVGVGTGIGLSVCVAVVQKLGGRINVQSRVGHGTTFEVRVPTGWCAVLAAALQRASAAHISSRAAMAPGLTGIAARWAASVARSWGDWRSVGTGRSLGQEARRGHRDERPDEELHQRDELQGASRGQARRTPPAAPPPPRRARKRTG